MFEKLKEMNAEPEQLKAAHLEKSKAMFTEVSKELFDKHPLLESFGWRQYTPYFNDGEECTFSAHVDDPNMNGLDDDELYEVIREKDYDGKPHEKFNPVLLTAYTDVQEFLSNVDEAALRDMFGDHMEITVSRDGTEVEEYEHD